MSRGTCRSCSRAVKDRHNLAAKKRLIGANQAHAREADRDGQQMDMSHHAMFQLTIQAGAGPGDFGKKDIIVQNRRSLQCNSANSGRDKA